MSVTPTTVTVFLPVWLLLCVGLYRATNRASWLAGITVSTGLFFLGATVAASLLVRGAMRLAPLWAIVAVVQGVHLGVAQAAAQRQRELLRTPSSVRAPCSGPRSAVAPAATGPSTFLV